MGPAGVGRRTTALAFAMALNCLHDPGETWERCDTCHTPPEPTGKKKAAAPLLPLLHGSCLECQTIAHHNHPDVRVVEKPKDRETLPVDELRRLIEELGWKSYRGRHKVWILDYELLNLAGANTLLKTLEEPAPGTVLILLAASREAVLPTIASRCQPVAFGPIPAATLQATLESRGVAPEAAQRLALLSDGSLSWALERAGGFKAPEPVLLQARDQAAALAVAEKLAAEEDQEQLAALESLISQVRDIILWTETRREDWVADPKLTADLARRPVTPAYWRRLIRRLETARRQVLAHANARLLWTVLAGDLQPRPEEVA